MDKTADFSQIKEQIASLAAEITAMTKDAESRTTAALDKILNKQKYNLEVEKELLKRLGKENEHARLDVEREILDTRLRNSETASKVIAETLRREEKTRLTVETRLLDARLKNERAISSIRAERAYREQLKNKEILAELIQEQTNGLKLRQEQALSAIELEKAKAEDLEFIRESINDQIHQAELQNTQTLTAIKIEAAKTEKDLRAQAELELNNQNLQNLKARTRLAITTINKDKIAQLQASAQVFGLKQQNIQTEIAIETEKRIVTQKAAETAEAQILALRLANIQVQEKIEAEKLARSKAAQLKAANDINNLKLQQEQLETQLAAANINAYEKAVLRAQNKITQAKIAEAELEADLQAAAISRLQDAENIVQRQIKELKNAFEQLQTELITGSALAGADVIMSRMQKELTAAEVAYDKKHADLLVAIGKTSPAKVKVAKRDEHGQVMTETKTVEVMIDGVKQTVEQTIPIMEEVEAAWAFAAQGARDAILDTNLAVQNMQLELNKWNALHSSEFEASYRKAANMAKALEQRMDFNKKYEAALAKAGVTSDSKEGQAIKNHLEKEQGREVTAAFADEITKQIPLIGVKFGEVGMTIREQLDMWRNVLRGAGQDLNGNRFDKKSAKQDFNDALKAGRAAGEAGSISAKVYKKEIKDTLNKDVNNTGKSGKQLLEEYLQAKAAYEGAGEGDDKEALKQAFEDALSNTGLTENQASAAEAAEKQKQSTQNGWANATAILANIAQKLDGMVDEIALKQAQVDTRLYGSRKNGKFFNSYWRQISFDLSAAMLSPVIKEETLVNNVIKAVDMGIARDVQQFGMLETIKDKIATTFNTFDGTMLRLIRIQDNNTAAARLGMEASLNELLNQMYETTEYLTDLAGTVRAHLEEAEALMQGENAVDFEYQVQKWLGSLSSVGMSSTGVNAIAEALGKLASGDIEGISNGGVGNLLVMAANNANLSIADVLADGLDASKTNVLLNQMVGYLYELVKEANGNLVVQQQLAKVFGLTASDLKAATNLIYQYNGQSGQMKTIFNKGLGDTYNAMLGNLGSMADSMLSRTSLGEMLTNIWANVQYSTAAGEADNPVLYLLTRTADILDTFAGGIPIPAISVFGSGVDTKLTVSNIMKTAAMVGGFTQSLISMIGSMAKSGGSGVGSGLLKMVGIKTTVDRGASTSQSGTATVYNASVEDTTESATAQGKDDAKQETVKAKEESTEVDNKTIDGHIVDIYNLLQAVVDGNAALKVKITDQPIGVANDNSHWAWPPSEAIPGIPY